MTSSWRALALLARDRLVTSTDPEDLALVLSLWHLRLSSLARLRLYAQASQECTNLFNVLQGIPADKVREREWVFERLLPFELEVLWARVRYWAGEHQLYLEELGRLVEMCRKRARGVVRPPEPGKKPKDRETLERENAMWKERGVRVGLMMASQLIEMKVRDCCPGIVSTWLIGLSLTRTYLLQLVSSLLLRARVSFRRLYVAVSVGYTYKQDAFLWQKSSSSWLQPCRRMRSHLNGRA
jgi:hypothetical protein